MGRIEIKVPTTRNEALWLFRAYGIEVLRDQARIDPNPHGAAARLLDDLRYRADLRKAVERIHVPKMPEPKRQTLGDLRKGFSGLHITCTRCWYESTVPFSKIPRSRDRWPLSWLKFPHEKCGARGVGMIRVVPVK